MRKFFTLFLCFSFIALFIPACKYMLTDDYWIDNQSSKMLRVSYVSSWQDEVTEEEVIVGPLQKVHITSFQTSFGCADLGQDFLSTNFNVMRIEALDSAELELDFRERNNWFYEQIEVRGGCNNSYTLSLIDSHFN